ncbi:DUF4349 domain-containing protein [Streptomyces albipurpureus]|uniref:DUF4349 domain-containing protein n=1 Tax=Streptomyces albipurpureus TaxID=2897419 RepID=A0ABT0UES5_9ACTN|nr:DUF4349 domain-containing protein [Streptomyces sp. CWNU-1]MCM2387072.1 DUF4349 domain-containing protein [Streptomyces sp. CWNU-1]
MRTGRVFTVLLLTASLAVAGCGASDDGDSKSAASSAEKADMPRGAGAADSAVSEPGASKTEAAVKLAPSHIIRTAELQVRVKDSAKALVAARRTAERAGGHVAEESTERVGERQLDSRVVLRVPQEKYDQVLTTLAGSGELLSRTSNATDVTDQVVDVDSRIATQRASVTRVRVLMDKADKLADVVTLEGQLSTRQAELESLLARQASLKDRTTLATIELSLSETATAKDDEEGDPGFLDALEGGWDALVTSLRWTVVVLGAVAPFLALLGLLYALWRWAVRPRLRQRAIAAEPTPAPLPAYAPGGAAPTGEKGPDES